MAHYINGKRYLSASERLYRELDEEYERVQAQPATTFDEMLRQDKELTRIAKARRDCRPRHNPDIAQCFYVP